MIFQDGTTDPMDFPLQLSEVITCTLKGPGLCLHSICKDASGENQRGCHLSFGDQDHFRISSEIAEGNFSESLNCSPTERGDRLTMNFSRSIEMPFLWHENIPHHISAMKQQTSFSEYSTEGEAFILNFKASLVFRFLYYCLITTSITTIQKYHKWQLGPKLE